MIAATILALLPVGIIVGLAAHDLRPWWRQFRDIRALPETCQRDGER